MGIFALLLTTRKEETNRSTRLQLDLSVLSIEFISELRNLGFRDPLVASSLLSFLQCYFGSTLANLSSPGRLLVSVLRICHRA